MSLTVQVRFYERQRGKFLLPTRLVVIHEDREVLQRCRELLVEWLAQWGLVMKESKTRLVHTLHATEEHPAGFDFLGMTVRQFSVGRTHSGKDQKGKLLGYKNIIKPSRSSQRRHWQELQEIIHRHRASPQQALIRELNPVIKGWCAYYKGVVSKDVFSRMDYLLYNRLYQWAMRRHHYRNKQKVVRKYWRLEKGSWKFETLQGVKLGYHSSTAIVRHVKVIANRSVFDGDWVYWGNRLSRHSGLSREKVMLLSRQQGRCSYCGLPFTVGDELEKDHRVPKVLGGKEELANFELLHKHCHHQKTRKDGSMLARGSGIRRGAV